MIQIFLFQHLLYKVQIYGLSNNSVLAIETLAFNVMLPWSNMTPTNSNNTIVLLSQYYVHDWLKNPLFGGQYWTCQLYFILCRTSLNFENEIDTFGFCFQTVRLMLRLLITETQLSKTETNTPKSQSRSQYLKSCSPLIYDISEYASIQYSILVADTISDRVNCIFLCCPCHFKLTLGWNSKILLDFYLSENASKFHLKEVILNWI